MLVLLSLVFGLAEGIPNCTFYGGPPLANFTYLKFRLPLSNFTDCQSADQSLEFHFTPTSKFDTVHLTADFNNFNDDEISFGIGDDWTGQCRYMADICYYPWDIGGTFYVGWGVIGKCYLKKHITTRGFLRN